ncbi:TonB-dependent siderophore receptor [uncultured Ramlibacter sp.]|uniref:TonB-dependent siderophore receptor n=1 Tax=uncultured Ramlibacter sp. TaxID=260755 RepID=UPI002606BB72|nr:TonB-dependent siderophore receptor [uncultured Ramlibacter sp.]
MKNTTHNKLNPLALAALTLLAGSALAQTLPEVKVTDTGKSSEGTYIVRELEAGKIGASVRETPQSITVITRQQLDDRNFTKVEDALKSATGVVVERFDGAGNYNTIRSRGFEIGSFMLDGMPIVQGPNYATALDTAIYDRIEVLRGPSGLLQGAGEPGGTINLVRKRALGLQSIGANVSAGSFGQLRADVDLTGPLNAAGTLRGRLVAVADDRDSYVDVLHTKKRAAYGTLELDIAPSTTLSAGYTAQRVDSTTDQGLPAYANGQLLDVPRSTFAGVAANRQDMDTRDAFAEIEHRLGGGALVKFAVRDVQRDNFYRSGRSNSAVAPNGDYRFETVDLQGRLDDRSYDVYLSTPWQLAGRQHKLLLGANSNERTSGDGNFAYGPTSTFNIYRPNYGYAYPNLVLPGFTAQTQRKENALYGQGQFSLADSLKLLAGGRLSWAKVATERTSDGVVTARSEPGRQFMPSVAALYDLNAQLTAYASYAETFVIQTQMDRAGALLPPRTGKQLEFGLKGEFLNKRLQTTAAVFRIDDVNRAVVDPVVSTASIAGGEVRSQGFELEASGQVAPGWDLLAGYAYTDTEYIKAPVAQQGQVFSPVTPRHMVNLSTRYAFRDALRGWSVGGGLSWRSEFYAQSGALRLVSGNYTLANVQVAWQANDKVNLSLGVDNLFDETYYEKVSGVTRQNFYGEPRRAVLAMKVRY